MKKKKRQEARFFANAKKQEARGKPFGRLPLASCFLLFLFFIISSSCVVKRFDSPIPNYNPETDRYVPKASILSMPIEVQMSTLTNSMNQILSGLIYEDVDYDNNGKDNLQVRVWRTKKEITVEGDKDILKLYLPLEIWARYKVDPCKICPSIEKSTNFNMDITLQTNLKVGKNWEIIPTTSATDVKFITAPTLSFDIGIDVIEIPITSIVKSALMSNMQSITNSIDEEVGKSIPLKKYMEDVWSMVQDPQLMDTTYKAWLTLSPVEIYLSPLNCDKKKLKLYAGISTFIDTKLGDKPIVAHKYTLTEPIIKDKLDNKFNLELPVSIDFKMATELANRNFKDSIFQVSKNKKIKVNDILIYGKGGEVFVKADLSGSFNGLVFFRGQPAFDTLTNKVYFKDIDFDLSTKNILYKAAAWLLHGTIKKIMARNFVYDISKDIEGAKISIRKYLSGYNYANLLTVKGSIDDVKLKKIITTDEGVKVVFQAAGTVGIMIDNINMGK